MIHFLWYTDTAAPIGKPALMSIAFVVIPVFVSISGSKFEIKLQSLHAASARVLLSPTHLQMALKVDDGWKQLIFRAAYVALAVLQG